MQWQTGLMSIVWEKDGEAFCAAVTDEAGRPQLHLMVESEGHGWDWAVWRPGEDRASARHGRTTTRHAAMWDAERATL
jgi:hypothetical protein